jgi:hypothetical protein
MRGSQAKRRAALAVLGLAGAAFAVSVPAASAATTAPCSVGYAYQGSYSSPTLICPAFTSEGAPYTFTVGTLYLYNAYWPTNGGEEPYNNAVAVCSGYTLVGTSGSSKVYDASGCNYTP